MGNLENKLLATAPKQPDVGGNSMMIYLHDGDTEKKP